MGRRDSLAKAPRTIDNGRVTAEEIISNPGYLKLELLTKGVRLDRSALQSREITKAFNIAAEVGTRLELDLLLPGNVLVNIPIQECLSKDTPYLLRKSGTKFYIKADSKVVKVDVIPVPKFYERLSSKGRPLLSIGRTSGNYLLISPTVACEFLTQNLPCKYCNVASRASDDKSVAEVLETVEAAMEEGAAEFICLNVGYEPSEDGGIARLYPYIKAIKENFDTLICVQAQPPKTDEWIDLTYAAGVDSIAYNLEVFDSELFTQVAPGKMQLIGRDRYFEALRRAVKVFPAGTVVSNLIVGLEPAQATVKGIDFLTAAGVIPTLPILRPAPGLGLKARVEPELEVILPIFNHLQKALQINNLSPSWISHFNMVVNTLDGNFGGQAPVRRGWAFPRSKRRHKLALHLRRRFRVRSADESESHSG